MLGDRSFDEAVEERRGAPLICNLILTKALDQPLFMPLSHCTACSERTLWA